MSSLTCRVVQKVVGVSGVLVQATCWGGVLLAAIAWTAASVSAQQTTVRTPFHSNSSSFFEQIGTQWGIKGPNFSFQFGGGGMGQPSFGNPDASAGIRSGWAWNSGPWSGNFNFIAAQGSRTGMISQTPSITLPNGGMGYFSDTSQSPFVIGFIPVVGGAPFLPHGYPMGPPSGFGLPHPGVGAVYPERGNPRVQAMLRANASGEPSPELAIPEAPRMAAIPAEPAPAEVAPAEPPPAELATSVPASPPSGRASSAAVAAPSVAEARRMHEQEQAAASQEAMQLYERGITAEESGKPGLARVYYRMAASRSDGALRDQIEARLSALAPVARNGQSP